MDARSAFGLTFANSARLQRYLKLRQTDAPRLEQANLIERLLLVDPNQVGPGWWCSGGSSDC
jgi:hypothetical protein